MPSHFCRQEAGTCERIEERPARRVWVALVLFTLLFTTAVTVAAVRM